ncbi:hypothetical protein JQC92_05235 [Shewanella sp. 202IG2-18]|uniref:hypothetical protein n=1 Tax=Parashewanella hymeniacidonis TaxID=2807618 RepID=UPI00195F54EB|nr:hypothetical protein [Parashewanella hymeniacidonis]MBM7071444.1 hypothetical protein [Parashewanella hymeniacidonis]
MTSITPLHAAHIAAQNADMLYSDDDDIKGGTKGKGRKRALSNRGNLKSSTGHHNGNNKARKGKNQQNQLNRTLNSEVHRQLDELDDEVQDIGKHTQDYKQRHAAFAKLSDHDRLTSTLKSDNKFINDLGDLNKDCNDFYSALKKDYGNLGSGSLDGAQAIAEINDLMFKLAKMFQALRNIVQDAKTLFDKLNWDIKMNALNQKMDAIGQTRNAAMLAGGLSVAGAAIGSVASVCGVVGGAVGKVGIGESLSIGGQMFSKLSDGAGSMGSAQITYQADIKRTVAGLVDQISEQFSKDVSDAYSRANKTSVDMISLLTELVNLHRAIESALSK